MANAEVQKAELEGKIEFEGNYFEKGGHAPKSIRQFVRKKVGQWAKRLGISAPAVDAVRVRVDRLGQGHDVGCSIEVSMKGQRRSQFHAANDLNLAIQNCLNRLELHGPALVPVPA
ncbi:MAG: hypothetical protein JNL01_04460 [Bdellovibrionales bacterium]|nr:hypothetical protein [Bdellovibrionales bacterium]